MRYLTKQEKRVQKAFGIGFSKPFYNDRNGIRRWMDDGEIIEFTHASPTSNNSEFTINNDNYHKIWFSQLAAFFFSPKTGICVVGYAEFKDGSDIRYIDMTPDEFWQKVEGKKFRVHIHPEYNSTIDNNSKHFMMTHSYGEIIDFVKKSVGEDNLEALTGLLKEARMYLLEEI